MLKDLPQETVQNLDFESYRSALSLHSQSVDLSFVIPVFNEENSLQELTQRIAKNVPAGMRFEIILVDDGSTDDSWKVIRALCDLYRGIIRGDIHGFRFRSNRGKAAGLQVGFDAAAGDYIFTMDGDLQDDPQEIPRFLAKIDEGYDLVSGWKKVRHDPWHKVFPRLVVNHILSYFSQVILHDHKCGFKCYKREVAKSIKLFGDVHRMIPSLEGMQGLRVAEIPVQHHPTRYGYSQSGVEHFNRGFSDMLTTGFLRQYRERPLRFANAFTATHMCIGLLLMLVGLLAGITSIQGILLELVGVCFLGFAGACSLVGLFCELMIRQNRGTERSAVVNQVRSQVMRSAYEPSETQGLIRRIRGTEPSAAVNQVRGQVMTSGYEPTETQELMVAAS